MEAHLEDLEPAPHLEATVATIHEAWQSMGQPAALIQGMAGGLFDNRAQLYVSRIAWLDEHRCTDPDDRYAVLSLWSTMDRVEISLILEAAAAGVEGSE